MERERFDDEDAPERETPDVDEPVYGDTDIDPNRDDQRDAHNAGSEEHI
ncbi:MAG TPA: hypothetical protein VFL13_06565 [Candidatus Baltobacteraceae bacterium]|nr:hypothetical protein [Candidatus Baltobacteraceae bacterium]